jgi:hypothetical protein
MPRPEAKFIVPHWRDKVDSGIGFSYRAGGPVGQLYAEVNNIPQSGTMNLATAPKALQKLKCASYYSYIFINIIIIALYTLPNAVWAYK